MASFSEPALSLEDLFWGPVLRLSVVSFWGLEAEEGEVELLSTCGLPKELFFTVCLLGFQRRRSFRILGYVRLLNIRFTYPRFLFQPLGKGELSTHPLVINTDYCFQFRSDRFWSTC